MVLLIGLTLVSGQAVASGLPQQIVEEVNVYRQQAGVQPVKLSLMLNAAARGMVSEFLKPGQMQNDPCDGLAARGYAWQTCQFTTMLSVAADPDPKAVVDAWRQRMDITHGAFTEIGVGVVRGTGHTVFGCFATSPMPKATFSRDQFLDALKRYRFKNKRSPALSYDERLNKAAQSWADAHNKLQLDAVHRHGDSNLESRLKDIRYPAKLAVENVGRFTAPDPSGIIAKWHTSKGHRDNMLKEEVREVGVGCAHAPLRNAQDLGEYVCVLVLAAPQ